MAGAFILFDFNGTVIDSMGNYGILAAEVIKKHLGLSLPEARKKYYQTIDLPFQEQLEIIAPKASSEQKTKCLEEYKERKLNDVLLKSKTFPDIKDLLTGLKKQGHVLVISSSTKAQFVNSILAKHGLTHYFQAVYGKTEGKKLDHVNLVREKFNPETTVFIGNDLHDVELKKYVKDLIVVGRYGAKTEGMKTAGELKKAGADFVFSDLRNLLIISGIAGNT